MDPLHFLACHASKLDLETPDMFLSSYRSFIQHKNWDLLLSLQERRKSGEKFLQEYNTSQSLMSLLHDDHITVFHPQLRSLLDAIVVDDNYDPVDMQLSYTDYHISRKEFIHKSALLYVTQDGKLRIPSSWRRIQYKTKDVHIQNFGDYIDIRDWVSFDTYIASIDMDAMARIYETLR